MTYFLNGFCHLLRFRETSLLLHCGFISYFSLEAATRDRCGVGEEPKSFSRLTDANERTEIIFIASLSFPPFQEVTTAPSRTSKLSCWIRKAFFLLQTKKAPAYLAVGGEGETCGARLESASEKCKNIARITLLSFSIYTYLSLPTCLSLCVSFSLWIFLSMCLCLYESIYLLTYVSMSLSTVISICVYFNRIYFKTIFTK